VSLTVYGFYPVNLSLEINYVKAHSKAYRKDQQISRSANLLTFHCFFTYFVVGFFKKICSEI